MAAALAQYINLGFRLREYTILCWFLVILFNIKATSLSYKTRSVCDVRTNDNQRTPIDGIAILALWQKKDTSEANRKLLGFLLYIVAMM